MDLQSQKIEREKSSTSPLVNNDNYEDVALDDIESFLFKPITEGLGFHQDKRGGLNNHPQVLRRQVGTVKKEYSQERERESNSRYSTFTNHTDLKSEIRKVGTGIKIAKKDFSVSKWKQLGAWIVDTVMISAILGVTLLLFVVTSGIEYRIMFSIFGLKEVAFFVICLFSVYYLIYFTILDISSSPGKILFGLRLTRSGGEAMRTNQTLLRAMITLLSATILWLPMFFNVQGKLSNTKIVKK